MKTIMEESDRPDPLVIVPCRTINIPTFRGIVPSSALFEDYFATAGVRIEYLGDEFRRCFAGGFDIEFPAINIQLCRVSRRCENFEIMNHFGSHQELHLGYIFYLLERAELKNGFDYFFYSRDNGDILRIVFVAWFNTGWSIFSGRIEHPGPWKPDFYTAQIIS